jgi:hypothetical protein
VQTSAQKLAQAVLGEDTLHNHRSSTLTRLQHIGHRNQHGLGAAQRACKPVRRVGPNHDAEQMPLSRNCSLIISEHHPRIASCKNAA